MLLLLTPLLPIPLVSIRLDKISSLRPGIPNLPQCDPTSHFTYTAQYLRRVTLAPGKLPTVSGWVPTVLLWFSLSFFFQPTSPDPSHSSRPSSCLTFLI